MPIIVIIIVYAITISYVIWTLQTHRGFSKKLFLLPILLGVPGGIVAALIVWIKYHARGDSLFLIGLANSFAFSLLVTVVM